MGAPGHGSGAPATLRNTLEFEGFAWNVAAAATTLTAGPGYCADSTGAVLIEVTAASTTVNSVGTGLNKMDTGAPDGSDLYLYAMTNGVTSGFVLSKASTWAAVTKTNISGYNWGRLVGIILQGAASQITQYRLECLGGPEGIHRWEADATAYVINGGSSTTWAQMDGSAWIPAEADYALWWCRCGGDEACLFDPTGAPAFTNGFYATKAAGAANAQQQTVSEWLRTPGGSLYYKFSAAGAQLFSNVIGFRVNFIANRGQT